MTSGQLLRCVMSHVMSDDLTVEHGEPLEVLVGLQLLSGTQRHTESHGFYFPLNDVDVTGIQEEDKPAETESTGSDHRLTVEPRRCPSNSERSGVSRPFEVILQTTL